MSLLAGSELCNRHVFPEGAEFMTDKELEKAFDKYLFGLGWWDNREGRRRFGIDMRGAGRESRKINGYGPMACEEASQSL